MFADGMIQTLAEDLDIETQAYRPCRVYLNGKYWGILNLREKLMKPTWNSISGLSVMRLIF